MSEIICIFAFMSKREFKIWNGDGEITVSFSEEDIKRYLEEEVQFLVDKINQEILDFAKYVPEWEGLTLDEIKKILLETKLK